MTFILAPSPSRGLEPGVRQPLEEHRVLRLVAVRIGLGQQIRRTRLARQPPDAVLRVRLRAHKDVLALHLQVVLAQVDQHPLQIVAVLTDRPPAVLFDDLLRDPRLDLGLEDVALYLEIDGVLAQHLLVQGRKLNSHLILPLARRVDPTNALRRAYAPDGNAPTEARQNLIATEAPPQSRAAAR